jgi:hypothetical protein
MIGLWCPSGRLLFFGFANDRRLFFLVLVSRGGSMSPMMVTRPKSANQVGTFSGMRGVMSALGGCRDIHGPCYRAGSGSAKRLAMLYNRISLGLMRGAS